MRREVWRARIGLLVVWRSLVAATWCRAFGHRGSLRRVARCEYLECSRCHTSRLRFVGPLFIACTCDVERLNRRQPLTAA